MVLRELHVHAAVNLDNLAGDVAGEVAGQESGHVGDVFHLSAAAQGNLLDPFLANFVGQGGGHGCFDEARGNGVGTDAAAAHLLGNALGQGDEAGLGGGVVALSGVAMNAYDTGHVDDAAAALAHHDGRDGVDEVEGALEIDGDDGVPLLLGHAHHETVLGDAGVVDKNVDVAEVFVDFLHDGFRFGEVGGIAGIGAAGDAYGFYFFTRGFELY